MNFTSDLKHFEKFRPSASNLQKKSQSQEPFFLTVGQNNFQNKIPKFSKNIHLVLQIQSDFCR